MFHGSGSSLATHLMAEPNKQMKREHLRSTPNVIDFLGLHSPIPIDLSLYKSRTLEEAYFLMKDLDNITSRHN